MRKLTQNDKEFIRNLSNKGLSLRKIQNITKVPLSTIQYNLNKNSGRKRTKEIQIPKSDFLKGEIIGAFAGDGCYTKRNRKRGINHFIRFFLSYNFDKEYKDYLMLAFQIWV